MVASQQPRRLPLGDLHVRNAADAAGAALPQIVKNVDLVAVLPGLKRAVLEVDTFSSSPPIITILSAKCALPNARSTLSLTTIALETFWKVLSP